MKIPDFKLERYFAQYEFCTKYLMCSSDPESWSTREILDLEPGSDERYLQLKLSYVPSEGSPGLRAQAAQIYTTITPDEVLMFVGGQEGIFCFFNSLLDRGDHVIVHTPCYQSHKEIASAIGAQVTCWEATPEEQWRLNPDDLRRMIRPQTKCLLINTPHNPTGYLMDRQSFDEIVRICQTHNIVLFSDEVFRESELDPANRLPAACDVSPTAVSLGVLSKSYGLPGLRVGWIATHDKRLLARMAAAKDYTTICNSGPNEFLGEIALRHRQQLASRTVALLNGNLALLDGFMTEHADTFSWVRPRGSPMAFPKLLRGDVDAFCERAVREAGVLLLPGTIYDHAHNHFRIGFGRENFAEALTAFKHWLRTMY
jgi:aspartate/methionine/tyrosine aminotransferase